MTEMVEKLREFREWIRTMRLRTVAYAVMYYFVAIRISMLVVPFYWYVLIGLFIGFGGAATMSANDLHDRFHDRKKGKDFAYKNVKKLRSMVNWLWAISLVLAGVIFFFVDKPLGWLSFALLALGFLYSFALHVKYVPGVYVAMTSTGPLLYAFVIKPTWQTGLMIIATFPFILGRETLKDIDDIEIDEGWKPTIARSLGAKKSKVFVGHFYLVAAATVLAIAFGALHLSTQLVPTILVLLALALLLVAVVMLFANMNHRTPKGLADMSMVIVMVTLLVFVK